MLITVIAISILRVGAKVSNLMKAIVNWVSIPEGFLSLSALTCTELQNVLRFATGGPVYASSLH